MTILPYADRDGGRLALFCGLVVFEYGFATLKSRDDSRLFERIGGKLLWKIVGHRTTEAALSLPCLLQMGNIQEYCILSGSMRKHMDVRSGLPLP